MNGEFSLLCSFSHMTCSEADGSKEINPSVRTYVEQPRDMLVSHLWGGEACLDRLKTRETQRNGGELQVSDTATAIEHGKVLAATALRGCLV